MIGKCEFFGLTRDWLDARFPTKFDDARQWFEAVVEAPVETIPAPARSGYTSACKALVAPHHGSVSLLGAHPQAVGWSMLSATGGAAEWGWEAVRATPGAQANRIDAALDFRCTQRTFDRMFNAGKAICRAHERRPFSVGESREGRTLYFNWTAKTGLEKGASAKMPQFTARLYEKGKQLGLDPDWRRWEVTTRPDKGFAKERALQLEPHEILGSPAWSRDFLEAIGYSEAVNPGRASPYAKDKPESEDARVAKAMATLAHMGDQYGKAARELAQLVGKDEVRALIERALFETEQVEGDLSGPDLIRREAQKRWGDVWHHDLARRRYNKGTGMAVAQTVN